MPSHVVRAGVVAAAFGVCFGLAQAQQVERPVEMLGHPNLNGIWQAVNNAYWNLEAHPAELPKGPSWRLGAMGAIPAGESVVRDGKIPYLPGAIAQRDENRASWPEADPEAKCFMLGVPRVTYHNMTDHSPPPVDTYMGKSDGAWEGDTLVVTTSGSNGLAWLDRAGNYASNRLKVTERFRLLGANHLWYEATLEDPSVYSEPWTIEMPLYRMIEDEAQLLEHKCVPFAEPLMYKDLNPPED
jgi:hypothetical protein